MYGAVFEVEEWQRSGAAAQCSGGVGGAQQAVGLAVATDSFPVGVGAVRDVTVTAPPPCTASGARMGEGEGHDAPQAAVKLKAVHEVTYHYSCDTLFQPIPLELIGSSTFVPEVPIEYAYVYTINE